jgi:Ferredoxin-like domain in Api92-like protein
MSTWWCYNLLIVRGDESRVRDLAEAVRGRHADGSESPFSFASVVPPPSDPVDGIHSWCLDHWGTRDEAVECCVYGRADGLFELSFQTNWVPPDRFVVALSELYPDLSFEHAFDQPGKQVRAEVTYQDGKVVRDEYWAEEFYTDPDDGGWEE